ncbi:MAG: flagellar basal body rod protein FlgB [Dehalobacter sp.]|nr:flagellar basal body rod protein FlgB [Dehalobacter sp.]
MAGWLDSPIFNLLEGGLDGLGLRQRVLADNIANNDTPDFKRSDVSFDKILQATMDSMNNTAVVSGTEPGHIPITGTGLTSNGFVVKDENTTYRNDGNNVDIDLEMTRLAENTLQYNSLSRMLTMHLSMLKQAIQE